MMDNLVDWNLRVPITDAGDVAVTIAVTMRVAFI